MIDDQQYWDLFENNNPGGSNLIVWSDKYETNNSDIDYHHIALMTHINRFYVSSILLDDIEKAVNELKLLTIYSKYHFEQEELSLGTKLREGHKINHEKLIRDLETLIFEIGNGKFKIKNLPDYLTYWFLDHIKEYDIPAFTNK